MKTIRDIITDQELLYLLALASRVCGENSKITGANEQLLNKQLHTLKTNVAETLTKIDKNIPSIIPTPSDGKTWARRNGKPK
jgi:hypothetical protein